MTLEPKPRRYFRAQDVGALKQFRRQGDYWIATFRRADIGDMLMPAAAQTLQNDAAGRLIYFLRDAGISFERGDAHYDRNYVHSPVQQHTKDKKEVPFETVINLTDRDFRKLLKQHGLELYGDSLRDPYQGGKGRSPGY